MDSSQQVTPLRTIQNLPTPKTGRRQSSGAVAGGGNMSHGDIRFFVRPQFASTQPSQTEQPYVVTALSGSSVLPAVATLRSVEAGFSQAGGFIVESQSDTVNVPVVDHDDSLIIISPEDESISHGYESTCTSVSQIDFNPAMASTQVLDFKSPAPVASILDISVALPPAADYGCDESGEHKLDGLPLRRSNGLRMTDGSFPAVMSTLAPEYLGSPSSKQSVSNNCEKTEACPSFMPRLVVDLKPYADCLIDDTVVNENNFGNESCDCRSESPDLFDSEDVCNESADADLKLLGVNVAEICISAQTAEQSKEKKIANDSCRIIAAHRSNDNLDSNASLSEKLVRRRQASKRQHAPSLRLDEVKAVRGMLRRAQGDCKEVVSSVEETNPKPKIVEDESDGRRRSLRMKRKKNVVDAVPHKPESDGRSRSVDILDEMDQV